MRKAVQKMTDEKLVKMQGDVNEDLVKALKEIRRECKQYLEWCKLNQYKPCKTVEKIREMCRDALGVVDVKASKIEDIQNGIVPRSQSRMYDYDPEMMMDGPDDESP